ncbi:hypothetical protein BAZSYMA_ACONTIG15578_1 [Bathymodiolus azoricus thioautotrophic gill symbiont]|uniref:Uncharacterized protein n=1 Tax=Bathymodiolus azoricus thioautotrophic gill symbiont TaxID=235205 RepID=A0A1H6L5W9_9GAMM|nr:hypothetical protein BAZSYMA_ACONTIG15578_1 [Bathymodiolus azoricus thioautotrophic gill symbiont]
MWVLEPIIQFDWLSLKFLLFKNKMFVKSFFSESSSLKCF